MQSLAEPFLRLSLLVLVVLPGASLTPVLRRLVLPLSAAAGCLALAAAAIVISDGAAAEMDLWSPAPYADLGLRLDPLGAAFMAIVGGTAVAASIFGTSYAHHSATDDITYPLFLASMLLVTAAANVYTFLVFWETMALTSFVLVLGDGTPRPRRQAALVYLIMTHIATGFVVGAFLLVADAAGTTTFADMAAADAPALRASLAFLLAVAGFGTKAGLVPLHIWLPRAHPVAPSHVSALMSAAMVTTGLYGLTRVGYVFLGPGEAWWGLVLIAIGAASALFGVLYALMERDLKRVLAYSTVENAGIAAVGLGAAITLRAEGEEALAAAALLGSLVHLMNHAWFKTLLFLAAGSVQRATQTLSLDHMGGLARRMPVTATAALVGSLAIAGLPPLNGFAGEWILLRGLAGTIASDAGTSTRLVSMAAFGALVLTSGLAVACFVRLYGMAFLGQPRSPGVAAASESGAVMYCVVAALAGGCVVTGLAAPHLVAWLDAVPQDLGAPSVAGVTSGHRLDLAAGGSISTAIIGGALILLAPLPWLMARALFGATRRAPAPVWATGTSFQPSMQYTATSFAKPIRLFFRGVLLPERRIEIAYHGTSRMPRLVTYSGRVPPLFEERLYGPVRNLSMWASARLRLLQSGSVQLYLLYVVVPLVVLVVLAR